MTNDVTRCSFLGHRMGLGSQSSYPFFSPTGHGLRSNVSCRFHIKWSTGLACIPEAPPSDRKPNGANCVNPQRMLRILSVNPWATLMSGLVSSPKLVEDGRNRTLPPSPARLASRRRPARCLRSSLCTRCFGTRDATRTQPTLAMP